MRKSGLKHVEALRKGAVMPGEEGDDQLVLAAVMAIERASAIPALCAISRIVVSATPLLAKSAMAF